MQCANNLKQIALALRNYESVYHALPPAYTVDAEGKPLHSWRTLILPYLEQQALYDKIDLSKPWDDPANKEAYETDAFRLSVLFGRWSGKPHHVSRGRYPPRLFSTERAQEALRDYRRPRSDPDGRRSGLRAGRPLDVAHGCQRAMDPEFWDNGRAAAPRRCSGRVCGREGFFFCARM